MTDAGESDLTGLSIAGAVFVYLLTVFGLRLLLLRKAPALDPQQFREIYPHGKWLIRIHEILSYLAFIGSMLGGPLLATALWDRPVAVHEAAWLAVGGWNLFNGLFELITGVCPAYGLLIKRHSRQYYLLGEKVRRLGVVRIMLSVVMIGVVYAGIV